jgi:hypothetical protein
MIMANVVMNSLVIGEQYTAVQLAEIWGYESHHALVKGMVTPKDKKIIILFVTKEKQSGATQYEDELRGSVLYMMGQEKHGSDNRLMKNLNKTEDEIFFFYRDLHHTPFIYYGKVYLIGATIHKDKPSEFQFIIEQFDEIDDDNSLIDYIVNIPSTETDTAISLIIEGVKELTKHVRYERNPYNRKEAIRIQGHICKICSFDFNMVYGEDLAKYYIEVHHIKQLAEGEQIVDPGKDLLPVCANCHRMLHRKKADNVTVDELMKRLKAYSTLIKSSHD